MLMAHKGTTEGSQLRRELAGLGLLTLGVLLFVSLVWHVPGPLPQAVTWLLTNLLGVGAHAVPVALALSGGALLAHIRVTRGWQIGFGAGVLLLVFLSLCHLHRVDAADIWRPEVIAQRGGVLGAATTSILRLALRETGAYIVLFGSALAAILLISDVSGRDLLLGVGAIVRDSATVVWERAKGSRSRTPGGAPGSRISPSARRPDLETDLGEQVIELPPVPQPHKSRRRRDRTGEQLALMDGDAMYQYPALDLLEPHEEQETKEEKAEITDNIMLLEDTLASFGVEAKVVRYQRGPAVTRYEVEPARGIRVSKIANLADDLALALAAIDVRVEAPIPGRSAIGIEVPNRTVAIVPIRSILETEKAAKATSRLCFALGKDVAGDPKLADLARMPHLLVAGATNSGKSVCLNAIITSILFRASPQEVQFIMIDPKRVELTAYDGIPHLMAPVVQTAREAADVLRKAIAEMESRYDRFALAGVRNIEEYNAQADDGDRMHYAVIMVDELADLMMQAPAEFEFSICRLAQLARATGIHLVIATQRPSVNVITGTIKANISSRIALAVASQADSRVILDCNGAERLIGRGDMLFSPIDASKPIRMQGAYVSPAEVERLVEFLRQQGEPEFSIVPELEPDEPGAELSADPVADPLFVPAAQFVLAHDEASVSMLQRRFKVGYARAGRLIDMMEKTGIVGPYEGSKPRQVLMGPAEFVAMMQRHGEDPSGPLDPAADPSAVAATNAGPLPTRAAAAGRG